MPKRLTIEDLTEKIKQLRGGQFSVYDASGYQNNRSKIVLKCNKCNSLLKDVTVDKFFQGRYDCRTCNPRTSHNKMDHHDFIEKFNKDCKEIHNLVEVTGIYTGADKPIECMCKRCGKPYITTPKALYRLNTHFDCSYLDRISCQPKDNETFLKELESVPDYKDYEILDKYVKRDVKLRFRCKKCGKILNLTPNDFKSKNRRCPCNFLSVGEKRIFNVLTEMDINFDIQYTFDDLKDTDLLRFDFVIFNENNELQYLIEFDGKQHFDEKCNFGDPDKFKLTIKHDKMKNNYCKMHNINLLRIPYNEYDRIYDIIKETNDLWFND